MRKTSAACLPLLFLLTAASPSELARWKAEASRITITRDDWGIAHVQGKSDADAVFGMIYAQAEDDFPRIEVACRLGQGEASLAGCIGSRSFHLLFFLLLPRRPSWRGGARKPRA